MRRIDNRLLSELFQIINQFLDIDSEDLERGREIASDLVKKAEKIEDVLTQEERREVYDEIFSRLKKNFSKLSEDLNRNRESSLSSDWKRFAGNDLSRLKDDVLELQEFLKSNELIIRKALNKRSCGVDLEVLSLKLEQLDCVGDVVQSRFTKLLDRMDSDQATEKVDKHQDRLERISRWLIALKEVEEVSEKC